MKPHSGPENSSSSLIRVLQLGSPADLYGAERWILALVRHLDPSAVESWIAAIKDEPELEVPLCREAAKMGFRTQIFKSYGRANLSSVRQLRQFIKANRIDIIHTHAYKQDIIGLLAAVNTGCRTVSTPHGWSREPDIKLRCYEMLNRAIFPFFDAVVPLSDDLYLPLKRIPGVKSRLRLIRNGVDIREIDATGETAPEIRELRSKNRFILGYIGQLINRKGLDILLKALAMLPESADWHLLVTGEGVLRQSLESLTRSLNLADRVTFLGFRKDRIALLKGFDLFILPSRLEGIPRCLMEAMAARIPVLASAIPGCSDLITDGRNGLLFPPEDHETLARKIMQVRNSSAQVLSAMVDSARRTVEEKYSAARMAREYETLFRTLCQ